MVWCLEWWGVFVNNDYDGGVWYVEVDGKGVVKRRDRGNAGGLYFRE